jgi:hypothetical protein
MVSLLLEYLDVMRLDRRTGRTPNELINAHRLGYLASGAPSNIECENARYRIAIIEASQFAVVPIDLWQFGPLASHGGRVAKLSLSFPAEFRQRDKHEGFGTPLLKQAVEFGAVLVRHGGNVEAIDLDSDFYKLILFLGHVLGCLPMR